MTKVVIIVIESDIWGVVEHTQDPISGRWGKDLVLTS